MADLTIVKNAAYDQKVAGIATLRQEMRDRTPLIHRLAIQGDSVRLRQWEANDPLLSDMIELIRDGEVFLSKIGALLDD